MSDQYLCFYSTYGVNLTEIILDKILYVSVKSDIPRQLPQLIVSPFYE